MIPQTLHKGYIHTGIYQFCATVMLTGVSRNLSAVLICVSLLSQPPFYVALSVGEVCCVLGLVSSRPIFSTPLLLVGGTCMVPCCTLRTQDKRGEDPASGVTGLLLSQNVLPR